MPAWLLSLISSFLTTFGLPAIKQLIVLLLQKLEVAYPGSAALFQAVIDFLEGGGTAVALHEHLNRTLPGFEKA